MSLLALQDKIAKITSSVGKAGLHALAPNDFEYYLFALELINTKTNKTEEEFTFPVNPNSFTSSQAYKTTVTSTAGGVVVLSTDAFVPLNIELSGTFGRKLRILLGRMSSNSSEFDFQIKTGYGTTKILERIAGKCSSIASNGGLYKLYLYNLSFNQTYLIEPESFSVNMTLENNMLWNYALSLKAIAPASLSDVRTIKKSIAASLTRTIDIVSTANEITSFAATGLLDIGSSIGSGIKSGIVSSVRASVGR